MLPVIIGSLERRKDLLSEAIFLLKMQYHAINKNNELLIVSREQCHHAKVQNCVDRCGFPAYRIHLKHIKQRLADYSSEAVFDL